MTENSSQSRQPESSSGARSGLDQALDAPQAAPAVGSGPDSHTLPRTVEPQVARTDWEARYKGLDSRYQKDREEWMSQLGELRQQVQELAKPTKAAAPAEPQAKPQANAASTQTPADSNASTLGVLDQAIQQRKAENYRDLVVEQVAKELGMPALEMFSNDIPIVPPTRNNSGELDDSGQRAAVKTFADKLRGVAGEASQRTQDAIREGMTPGASPGSGPAEPSKVYEEFLDLMEVLGSTEFDELSPAERRRAEQRYLELVEDPEVQELHQGETSPTMSYQDVQGNVKDLLKRIAKLEGRTVSPYGNMG